MRIIITGGTGLIGRSLVSNLAKDYEVVVLSRSPEKHQQNMPSSVKLVQWDAATAAGWGELADGAFAIINLAGAGIADKRWSEERKQLLLVSRLSAGRAVVEAVTQAEQKPKVVMQASAVGYYGDRGDEILTERSTAGNDFPAQISVPWEQSTASVADMGVRHIIIRTGIVLSTKGGALPKLTLPYNFFAGGPMGDGTQWMPWIHLEDEIRAIRFLMEDADAEGVYNLCAPAPVMNKVVAQKLGLVMDRPALVKAPAFALKLALGEMSAVVLHGQRVIPERLIAEGYKFRFSDVETALRDLI